MKPLTNITIPAEATGWRERSIMRAAYRVDRIETAGHVLFKFYAADEEGRPQTCVWDDTNRCFVG